MQLYSLYFSRTKNGRQELLMTDSLKKCESYKKAREATKSSKAGQGFHEIKPAEPNQDSYRRKSSSRKTGYISKNGWNPHT